VRKEQVIASVQRAKREPGMSVATRPSFSDMLQGIVGTGGRSIEFSRRQGLVFPARCGRLLRNFFAASPERFGARPTAALSQLCAAWSLPSSAGKSLHVASPSWPITWVQRLWTLGSLGMNLSSLDVSEPSLLAAKI